MKKKLMKHSNMDIITLVIKHTKMKKDIFGSSVEMMMLLNLQVIELVRSKWNLH